MSKQEDLTKAVQSLRQSVPEVSGVMIASSDGLPIAHDFANGDATRVAAIAATVLGLGKRIADTTGCGTLEETVTRGTDGYMIIYSAGTKAVLAVVAPAYANLGLIHLEARDVAANVAALMN